MEEQYKECLDWLESLDQTHIGEEEREYLQENFPGVEFNLVGVSSLVDDGEIKTPVRDYIHSIKYGKPLD
jgi:hypothetical protein